METSRCWSSAPAFYPAQVLAQNKKRQTSAGRLWIWILNTSIGWFMARGDIGPGPGYLSKERDPECDYLWLLHTMMKRIHRVCIYLIVICAHFLCSRAIGVNYNSSVHNNTPLSTPCPDQRGNMTRHRGQFVSGSNSGWCVCLRSVTIFCVFCVMTAQRAHLATNWCRPIKMIWLVPAVLRGVYV